MCKADRVWWWGSYLYYVEYHILIETVEDALCDTVVAPCPMHQQKLLQVGELRTTEEERKINTEMSIFRGQKENQRQMGTEIIRSELQRREI